MKNTAFTGEQYRSLYPDGSDGHYWVATRNKIINYFLHSTIKKSGRILEIGCGRGTVVKYLRSKGDDCWGCDLASVKPVDDAGDFCLYGIDFSEINTEFRMSIETVLLLDVIEHIENDTFFLKRVKGAFPNLKNLLLTVPARKELWSNYDEYNGHYRRYDMESLTNVVREGGLSVISRSYFFHSLYIPAKLLSVFKKKRSTYISSPTGLMLFLHRIISALFVLDFWLLPKKMIGTSIILSSEVVD